MVYVRLFTMFLTFYRSDDDLANQPKLVTKRCINHVVQRLYIKQNNHNDNFPFLYILNYVKDVMASEV